MRTIKFEVSEQLIRQALAIPEDAEIMNIVRHDFIPGVFMFYVSHSSFPELKEGATPPQVTPIITADYEKRPETWLTIDFCVEDVLHDIDLTDSNQE